jgi:hypothetical protein
VAAVDDKGVDVVGEAGDRGSLEQTAPRDLHVKQVPDLRQHLRGQQRLAADSKKLS